MGCNLGAVFFRGVFTIIFQREPEVQLIVIRLHPDLLGVFKHSLSKELFFVVSWLAVIKIFKTRARERAR